MEFDELSQRVIGRAIEVHRTLGPGLLESTYRQCLALFFHRTEWQDDFAENFVQHLRQPCVNRGEATEDSLIPGEVFEIRSGADEVTDGEQEEKNGQRTENDLASYVQPQGAHEHDGGK